MNANNDNFVYVAPMSYLRQAASWMRELGVRPEFEAFDCGQLWQIKKLIEEGLGGDPPFIQLCLGVAYGAPQDYAILKAMIEKSVKGSRSRIMMPQ